MEPPVPCYLRTLRARSGLTQKEVAQLLGLKSGSHVGRLEKLTKSASLMRIFSLQILFGAEPRALFPGPYAEAEEAVMARAAGLYETLRDLSDARSAAKLRLLEEMLARATGANQKEA
jgi:transcriptional regulator with XRE-family HTH domain